MRAAAAAALLLLVAGPALAETFTEDFESFNLSGFSPELKPDQSWYNYAEGSDIGNVSANDPIEGTQSFRIEGTGSPTVDASSRRVTFSLAVPVQLTRFEFLVNATTITENSVGTQQVIAVESSAPARRMVEFYVMCTNSTNPDGCELRVRWQYADSTGQILVNSSLNQTEFKIEVTPNWLAAEFCLEVNDVDDGCFPMMELPRDVGRIRFSQYRGDIPIGLTFDNWTVEGAINGTTTPVEGDVANGIKQFAQDVRFTTSGSKFFLGLVVFLVLVAAVLVPVFSFGKDNTLVPALAFYVALVALWLVLIEFWPDWVGILLIIVVSALIAFTLRSMIGIRNATGGPGIVVGSLGYFIIASTFLAFSGYAGNVINLPTEPIQEDDSETATAQVGIVTDGLDCGIAVVTFGLGGDCKRGTTGGVVKFVDGIIETISKVTFYVFSYIRAAVIYVFQLLTFQLPIPVLFNILIVMPPAAALATLGFQTIRGTGS